jgi:Bifunctional DNA primase/polymerase, N-terminal
VSGLLAGMASNDWRSRGRRRSRVMTKRVLTTGWPTTPPLVDGDAAVATFAARLPGQNPAIVLRTSKLIGLDCDTPEGLEQITRLRLPQTLTAQSSAPHKRHFYFRPPAGLERVPFVAFRFEKQGLTADQQRYLVCPPATHPSGTTYRFLPERGDMIAEMPLETYDLLVGHAKREQHEARERLAAQPGAKVREGNRRTSVFRFAAALRRWHGNDRDAILEHANLWNQVVGQLQRCTEGRWRNGTRRHPSRLRHPTQ